MEPDNSGLNLTDSVQVGHNAIGPSTGDIVINSGGQIERCSMCKTPIDAKTNPGLYCFKEGCDTLFCKNCESFFRSERAPGERPYCSEHIAEFVGASIPNVPPGLNQTQPVAAKPQQAMRVTSQPTQMVVGYTHLEDLTIKVINKGKVIEEGRIKSAFRIIFTNPVTGVVHDVSFKRYRSTWTARITNGHEIGKIKLNGPNFHNGTINLPDGGIYSVYWNNDYWWGGVKSQTITLANMATGAVQMVVGYMHLEDLTIKVIEKGGFRSALRIIFTNPVTGVVHDVSFKAHIRTWTARITNGHEIGKIKSNGEILRETYSGTINLPDGGIYSVYWKIRWWGGVNSQTISLTNFATGTVLRTT